MATKRVTVRIDGRRYEALETDGNIWFPRSTIAKMMGVSEAEVERIYQENKHEFGPDDVREVEVPKDA